MKKAAAVAATAAIPGLAAAEGPLRVRFIHHVYFWLNRPDSVEDRQKLAAGLKRMGGTIKTIQQFHVGVPAATHRDVVDNTYAVSWLAIFKNGADQESYQKDPLHLKFIEECSSLWKKVIVYDTVDA